MSAFQFREAVAEDSSAIRAVVFDVLSEYDLAPDRDGADADLEDVVASYGQRGGSFRVLVSPAGAIVGCGGLYPIDRGEAEIRKMYFLPEARGRGLGRQLLQDLVDCARERGFERIVLETASVLDEAISLYRKNGFVPLARERLTCRCDQAYVLSLGPDPQLRA